jgi:type I restriction enzyme S subunit
MIADLKPYPEYKESAHAWIGRVPAHWEVLPLGRLLAERKEMNEPIKTNNILSLKAGVAYREEARHLTKENHV